MLALLRRLSEASPPEAFSWNPILLLEQMAGHDDVVYCPISSATRTTVVPASAATSSGFAPFRAPASGRAEASSAARG